jgi:hypothetical protein
MLLVMHILAALLSILMATLAVFSPSQYKLRRAYELGALTLVSGTYLAITTHASLMAACTSGLAYLSVVATLIVVAQFRLSSQRVRSKL